MKNIILSKIPNGRYLENLTLQNVVMKMNNISTNNISTFQQIFLLLKYIYRVVSRAKYFQKSGGHPKSDTPK